jgi:hypothetical protein
MIAIGSIQLLTYTIILQNKVILKYFLSLRQCYYDNK